MRLSLFFNAKLNQKVRTTFWFWLLLAAPALATTFGQKPFVERASDAPIIARGRVGGSSVQWAAARDGARRLYTYIELDVTEVLRGTIPRNQIQVRELGGEKDGVGMRVAGSARFAPGEDAVVFLSPPNADGSYDVRNMSMGKFEVIRDEQGEERLRGAGMTPQEAPTWTLAKLRDHLSTLPAPAERNSEGPPLPSMTGGGGLPDEAADSKEGTTNSGTAPTVNSPTEAGKKIHPEDLVAKDMPVSGSKLMAGIAAISALLIWFAWRASRRRDS